MNIRYNLMNEWRNVSNDVKIDICKIRTCWILLENLQRNFSFLRKYPSYEKISLANKWIYQDYSTMQSLNNNILMILDIKVSILLKLYNILVKNSKIWMLKLLQL